MRQLATTCKQAVWIGVLSIALSGTLTGVNPGWAVPMPVTPEAIATQLDDPTAPLLLDVRSVDEFRNGHIPGAINIPYRQLPGRLDALSGSETTAIVVYCEVGVRASIAEEILHLAGFQQVTPLVGHLQAWRDHGLPIDTIPPAKIP